MIDETPHAPVNVLIVDDDENHRQILSRWLQRQGYLTHCVDSGQKALDYIKESAPHILLLDYMMPHLSGMQTLKRIREEHDASELPVVMVTALSDNETQLEALRTGANDFITKPMELELLSARISVLMERKLAQSTLQHVNAILEHMVDQRTEALQRTNDTLREEIERRIHTETELLEAKHTAEASNSAKTQFLASISHELRTPLNAIIGFSEIIDQEMLGPFTDTHYKSYVSDIHTSAKHLLAIISDILDASKIETGTFKIDPDRIHLNDILDECSRIMSVAANEKGVTLAVNDATALPTLYADSRLLQQALLNLMSNAIKFTDEGYLIEVDAHQTAAGGIDIIVTDNGQGIPPEMLDKVLEPFFQVACSYTRSEGGVGLGLAIVNAIIQAHDGTLSINSKEGEGTTVTLALPATCVLETVLSAQSA